MIRLTTIASAAGFLVYFICLMSFPNGINAGWSSGSSSGGKFPHDITSKQGLTELYNSGVTSVEHVTRPLGGSGGSLGVKHSGVVVTTTSGDRWLIHKGSGYGKSSETVVTDAKHMSGQWKSGGSQPVKPGTRVADFVKAGGKYYSLLFDNCHDGSKRMMDVGKPGK